MDLREADKLLEVKKSLSSFFFGTNDYDITSNYKKAFDIYEKHNSDKIFKAYDLIYYSDELLSTKKEYGIRLFKFVFNKNKEIAHEFLTKFKLYRQDYIKIIKLYYLNDISLIPNILNLIDEKYVINNILEDVFNCVRNDISKSEQIAMLLINNLNMKYSKYIIMCQFILIKDSVLLRRKIQSFNFKIDNMFMDMLYAHEMSCKWLFIESYQYDALIDDLYKKALEVFPIEYI